LPNQPRSCSFLRDNQGQFGSVPGSDPEQGATLRA
jgi:hypothetical protein